MARVLTGADRAAVITEGLQAALALGDEGIPSARTNSDESSLSPTEAARLIESQLQAALDMMREREPDDDLPAAILSNPLNDDGPLASLQGIEGQSIIVQRRLSNGAAVSKPTGIAKIVVIVQDRFEVRFWERRRDQLPPDSRIAAFESAVQTLRTHVPERWAETVARLLPWLPTNSPGALEQAMSGLGDDGDRSIALGALAPPLPVWSTWGPEKSDRRWRSAGLCGCYASWHPALR